VSTVLALALGAGIDRAFPYGVEPQLVDQATIKAETTFEQDAVILVRRVQQRPDGSIVSVQDAWNMAPDGLDDWETHLWVLDHFDRVEYRYVGQQLTEIELREAGLLAGLLAGLALLSVVGAIVVVERREPS
jgi:hypothetical protein